MLGHACFCPAILHRAWIKYLENIYKVLIFCKNKISKRMLERFFCLGGGGGAQSGLIADLNGLGLS